jgi:hypothetical protein
MHSRDEKVEIVPYARHAQLVDPVHTLPERKETHTCTETRSGEERTAPDVVFKGHETWRGGQVLG